jgi:methyl-accepting chemotaxis protein
MFNKKEINELREEITKKLDEIRAEFSTRLEQNSDALKELHSIISELKEDNTTVAEQVKKDLEEINEIKSNFESTLNRITSTARNIEETTSMHVKEVADKEIETIKASSKQFRGIEEELRKTTDSINDLQIELAKFISISRQIKLVDFSLKKHEEDMSRSERERMDLINENERLKTIMARMKRGR